MPPFEGLREPLDDLGMILGDADQVERIVPVVVELVLRPALGATGVADELSLAVDHGQRVEPQRILVFEGGGQDWVRRHATVGAGTDLHLIAAPGPQARLILWSRASKRGCRGSGANRKERLTP
jgi:hypothetical protein